MTRLTLPKLDIVSSLFLGFVILCGIVYTCLGLTPSSYGFTLAKIGAPEEGPIFGVPRTIRADEWSVGTPYLQASVRNGFQRYNETSFYHEDLRNFYLLPIKDWSLIFKPEMWAYFIISPATAFSLDYALLMVVFLVGYFLLFRQMGIDPFVSASVAVMLYFSGFAQFWWTSFDSLLGGLPWIFIVLFSRLGWWSKTAVFSWLIPVICFSRVYPTYFTEFAFAGVILIAALRPSLFRSPRDLSALAIGGLVTGVVFYFYFGDLIRIMQNTWYPAKRIGAPGTTSPAVVLSQLFPYLTFTLQDYHTLVGINICESGTVGSFLPLLTLCLLSPRLVWAKRPLRNGLLVIFAGLALILTWQLTRAPRWIGHVLMWDHGNAERLLFISGFLLTLACLMVWRDKLVSPSVLRIALFAAAGPVLSLVLKMAVFHMPLSAGSFDLALTALGVAGCVVACLVATAHRLPFLLATIALMNIGVFGRFNPIQAAEPIFQIPDTGVMYKLHQMEASTPGRYLLTPGFFGATLNGLGFRSVSHNLLSPALPVFRKYFPAMDATRFDFTFNRYAYVNVTSDPFPQAVELFIINVPYEAFAPVLNLRTVKLDVSRRQDCSLQRGGAIERVTAQGDQLIVEGWAPWRGEEDTQELSVTSARALRAQPVVTVKRPDISEQMSDYAFTRSGFQLQLSSADGRPIQPEEIVLVARGTSRGTVELTGCGCPSSRPLISSPGTLQPRPSN